MNYDTSIGIFGNLQNALLQISINQNEFNRYKIATDEHITTLEQQHTDSQLDLLQAQQDITTLQLEIEELKRKN